MQYATGVQDDGDNRSGGTAKSVERAYQSESRFSTHESAKQISCAVYSHGGNEDAGEWTSRALFAHAPLPTSTRDPTNSTKAILADALPHLEEIAVAPFTDTAA